MCINLLFVVAINFDFIDIHLDLWYWRNFAYETVLKKKVDPSLTFDALLFLCILRHFLIFGFFCKDDFCEHSTIASEGGGVRPIILMITIEASLRISSDLGMRAEVMEDARLNMVSVKEMFDISDDCWLIYLNFFRWEEYLLLFFLVVWTAEDWKELVFWVSRRPVTRHHERVTPSTQAANGWSRTILGKHKQAGVQRAEYRPQLHGNCHVQCPVSSVHSVCPLTLQKNIFGEKFDDNPCACGDWQLP